MEQTCACLSWQSGAGVAVLTSGQATLVDSNVYQNNAVSEFGGGLFIRGTAALTNVNVNANRAVNVCSSF